ncbi:MAG: carbon-nitrogen hydrolase family protein, partial [Armatimonadota bacterium]
MMKVAAAQVSPKFADVRANVARVCELLGSLASREVELAVFPEAMLTGYCFDSKEEALSVALSRESAEIRSLSQACNDFGISAVVGFAEREGNTLFNT